MLFVGVYGVLVQDAYVCYIHIIREYEEDLKLCGIGERVLIQASGTTPSKVCGSYILVSHCSAQAIRNRAVFTVMIVEQGAFHESTLHIRRTRHSHTGARALSTRPRVSRPLTKLVH
jgi:hypothetical protein